MIEIELGIIIALLAALWLQGTRGQGKIINGLFRLWHGLTGRK
jgi:hypothetical protein